MHKFGKNAVYEIENFLKMPWLVLTYKVNEVPLGDIFFINRLDGLGECLERRMLALEHQKAIDIHLDINVIKDDECVGSYHLKDVEKCDISSLVEMVELALDELLGGNEEDG